MAGNEVEVAEVSKVCLGCGEDKPLSAYAVQTKGRLLRRGQCKVCLNERAMQHRDRNQDMHLNSHLIRHFGITLDDYNVLLAAQNGVCAICGDPPTIVLGIRSRRQGRAVRPRLVVDHDHDTGKVRGLLCTPCNRGIGFLRDSPVLVGSALKYLGGC